MRFSDFLRKHKKALTMAALILGCAGIALFVWSAGKSAAIPGNDTPQPLVETQTKQPSEQGAELASEPEAELRTKPGEISQPGAIPQPGEVSQPGERPEPTEEPWPVLTEEHELIYEGINVFISGASATYFKPKDICADLYMRRQQDDTGEYIELSLWSDQKEIWHTVSDDCVNGDYEEDEPLWRKDSGHLTLDQRLCYYVVPVDGAVYLMRYCVETTSDAVTLSYKVFGISAINSPYCFQGNEAPLDIGSISLYLVSDNAVDPDVSFPVKEMVAFADTVKGYMENGYLAASTLRGIFETGASADRDNPVSTYLYDIFPWIPEMAAQHGVNTEDIHSAKQMFAALQKVLPQAVSVTMPGVAPDGKYFITGDYYSDSNESCLTIRMREDGSYGGTLLIDRTLYAEFTGNYDNGILTVTETTDDTCGMEISFQNGRATVRITAVPEGSFVKAGDTITLDRHEKPIEIEYLKNAEETENFYSYF